jgi:serine/threonine protein kinase/tetratricopeptide (TPR) repeat protein
MLQIGRKLLGRYEILSSLGAGGMGEVYRARDTNLRRDVAVKVLPERLASDPDALSRFEREARALAALSHPNILTIHDFGTDGVTAFAVMELLKGTTLRNRLAESKLSGREAVEIGLATAEGLAAAHSAGVIHRDLKPENIFLSSDGATKILDFGLARWEKPDAEDDLSLASTASRLTQAGTLLGTVPYMSPEQVRGHVADARSDIFSFGCVLYEMISGRRAFSGNTSADVLAAILRETPPQLDLNGEIPQSLNEIISRCLKKDPEERFQNARDLALVLRRVQTDHPQAPFPQEIGTLPFTMPEKLSLPERRIALRPILWTASLLFLVTAAFLFYSFVSRVQRVQSLAILPFINASNDPDTEYLCDGITEGVLDKLSQLPQLRVLARGTVFTYKGKEVDPRQAGRDLHVDEIVTGKFIQKADDLIIRAELVRVSDGTQLWGQTYKLKLPDAPALQDEITRKISESLRLKLTPLQRAALEKHFTGDEEAYRLYLKGRYYWYKDTPEDYERSIQYYQQAIDKDPAYALAYSGLADTYHSMTTSGLLPPKEGFPKVEAAAKKALSIDDTLAEAHVALAAVRFGHDWNWQDAEAEIKRATELNPKSVELHFFTSRFLRALGRFDESIREARRAEELDPLSGEIKNTLGVTFYWAGRYDEAIQQYKETIQLDPNNDLAHNYLADVYSKKGMYEEAVAEEHKSLALSHDDEGAATLMKEYKAHGYQEAKRLQAERLLEFLTETSREQYVSPMSFAILYSALNDKDQAIAWLEKAYQEHAIWMVFLKTDPQFGGIRSDKRFKEIMRKVGLPL